MTRRTNVVLAKRRPQDHLATLRPACPGRKRRVQDDRVSRPDSARQPLARRLSAKSEAREPALSEVERSKREREPFQPPVSSVPHDETVTPGHSLNSDLPSDVLLPEQFFTPARRSAALWSSERRLLLAVLQDALACWFHHRHARNVRGRRVFRETQDWFWAKDRDWLYAFECICEHLELDPDYLRRGLVRW